MKRSTEIEYTTTSVRLPEPTLKAAKHAAESLGMSQSAYLRFAITAMTNRVERGEI